MISLLTVTQSQRLPFFVLCAKYVAAQTSKDIGEWIIVDGTQGPEEAFEERVRHVCHHQRITIPFVFVRAHGRENTIGGLRNLANRQATGDVLVWIDDDDYYGPDYVQYIVDVLLSSECLVAGCTKPYYYDLDWKCAFQYARGSPTLTTNNCMAYKREYLTNHAYDESVPYGEEYSFLNGLKEPIAQLHPQMCKFVGLAHPWNMCSKSLIHLCAHYGLHQTMDALPGIRILPDHIIKDYEHILSQGPRICPYDIVYYTGGFYSKQWDPTDEDLGGSEQAIVALSREWTKQGKRVAVFGFFSFEARRLEDVDYVHVSYFRRDQTFDVLILWRIYGVWPMLNSDRKVDARVLVVDLHDSVFVGNPEFHDTISKFSKTYPEARFAFKSAFHKRGYEGRMDSSTKAFIVTNAVRDAFFERCEDIPRIPMRFCYCNAYERGLLSILTHVWPHIICLEPTAELHVYYGCNDPKLMNAVIKSIAGTLNVMHHGRHDVRTIVREKRMSTFHLYTTNIPAETDCISLKESCASGCIPVVVREGLFTERVGFFVDGDPDTPEGGRVIAQQILDLAKTPERMHQIRSELSKDVKTWTNVAQEWITMVLARGMP